MELQGNKLADYVDVFCERGAFTPDQSVRILRAAVANGLKTRSPRRPTHPYRSRTLRRVPPRQRRSPRPPHRRRHCMARKDRHRRNAAACRQLLPRPQYISTRPQLIDSGVAVALATDYNPGTSPTTSMPFVLSVACTHMKMSPAEAITAATINGACALNLQNRKGSLELGKDADIAIFDAEDYRELPYWFGVNRCWKTFLGGAKS